MLCNYYFSLKFNNLTSEGIQLRRCFLYLKGQYHEIFHLFFHKQLHLGPWLLPCIFLSRGLSTYIFFHVIFVSLGIDPGFLSSSPDTKKLEALSDTRLFPANLIIRGWPSVSSPPSFLPPHRWYEMRTCPRSSHCSVGGILSGQIWL